MILNENLQRFITLQEPIPRPSVEWRIDGKAFEQSGRLFARFVPFINAQTVQRRLDAHFPGEWNLYVEEVLGATEKTREGGSLFSFKGRLTVGNITRECIGTDETRKGAATDAFKRAAVRFGIGAELYDTMPNWVRVVVAGKTWKPAEDPEEAYQRMLKRVSEEKYNTQVREMEDPYEPASPVPASTPTLPKSQQRAADEFANLRCPVCKGPVEDQRTTRKNNQPLWKCMKPRGVCNRAIWSEDEARKILAAQQTGQLALTSSGPDTSGFPPALKDEDDDLPY